MRIRTQWLEKSILYDGTQLRSGWIKEVAGIKEEAIVAFRGKADVPIENMVDLEDVAQNRPIYSEEMLHFIVEIFECNLEKMVLRQRLLMAILLEELKKYPQCQKIRRNGDDLYDGDAKISVSIATTSPTSALIHTGLNILSENTPILTKGLKEYEIYPKTLALKVMEHFAKELGGIAYAATKVRSVS